MNRPMFFCLLMGWLALAVPMISGDSAGDEANGALKPGDEAPHFEKLVTRMSTQHPETPQEGPVALVFIRNGDMYSERTLDQLKSLEERNSDIWKQVRVVIVPSLMEADQEFDSSELPKRWFFLNDPEDCLYRSHKIIATPSIVLIRQDACIISFHAGYSPALVGIVQRNLLGELQGHDAVRTAAPPTSLELQLARRFAARGQWDRAINYFRAAAEREPLEPKALLEMACVLVELKEAEEALQILEVIKELEGAEELRQRALEIRKGEPEDQSPTNQ